LTRQWIDIQSRALRVGDELGVLEGVGERLAQQLYALFRRPRRDGVGARDRRRIVAAKFEDLPGVFVGREVDGIRYVGQLAVWLGVDLQEDGDVAGVGPLAPAC